MGSILYHPHLPSAEPHAWSLSPPQAIIGGEREPPGIRRERSGGEEEAEQDERGAPLEAAGGRSREPRQIPARILHGFLPLLVGELLPSQSQNRAAMIRQRSC